MATREQAWEVARRLAALRGAGAEVVRKAAARALAGLPEEEVPALLHHLQALARAGQEPADAVLAAVLAALREEADRLPPASRLAVLAQQQGLPEVAHLFLEAPAQRTYEEQAAAVADARAFSQPLGVLKQQARLARDPDALARLALCSDVTVVRNLLINPRLTEELVVRMAARRPARPEPLVEIWRSTRWSTRHAVRRALAFNPYLPPEVGARLLPLLLAADLAELAADASLHPSLREQARLLCGPPPQQ